MGKEHRSIYQLLRDVVGANRDKVAHRVKSDGRWHDVTWAEQEAAVRAVAKSLLALNLEKEDRVAVLGQTRLEWVQCDLGIVSCGCVTVGIYPSNLPDDCAYILDHSDARLLFVENDEQLDKIRAVRDRLPGLRHIVRFDGPSDPDGGIMSWQEFLAAGEGVSDHDLEARDAAIGPDDLASLVYTSGTTGVPKGVMITHRNLLFASESAHGSLYIEPDFCTLLFLPLAHVFARLIVYLCVRTGTTLAFAESFATVAADLREVRPHYFASVPRVFEKVHAKILGGVEDAGGLKARLFHWALGVGMEVNALRQAKRRVPALLGIKHAIATKLVLHKIQDAFGGRTFYAISGAAPLNKDIAEFFGACGVLILEGIGMTENTSFSNVNRFDNNKYGTVGPVGPGVEMKLADDGEVLFRGANVMKGYFKNPEATAETIDSEGWLHSGDIGEIDEDGFLRITDRKKDLIITAGGKNIAPQHIERVLRTSRYISRVVAIGDRRKYITALVTLEPETIATWAAEKGIAFETTADLAGHAEVERLIRAEVDAGNAQLASYESVKYFRILPRDLSLESGELTPTEKIKRKVVLERYGGLVEEMYSE